VSHALEGILAVDLTTVRSGPTCTRILADLGAEVVRIEYVSTSLLEALTGSLSFQAVQFLDTGQVPPPVGNHHPLTAPMGVYRARDGFLNLVTARLACLGYGEAEIAALGAAGVVELAG
jgi:crotonobetainyl-CoA:carnitine CoA-transferase CaiB-like acyl-CoA transferase